MFLGGNRVRIFATDYFFSLLHEDRKKFWRIRKYLEGVGRFVPIVFFCSFSSLCSFLLSCCFFLKKTVFKRRKATPPAPATSPNALSTRRFFLKFFWFHYAHSNYILPKVRSTDYSKKKELHDKQKYSYPKKCRRIPSLWV